MRSYFHLGDIQINFYSGTWATLLKSRPIPALNTCFLTLTPKFKSTPAASFLWYSLTWTWYRTRLGRLDQWLVLLVPELSTPLRHLAKDNFSSSTAFLALARKTAPEQARRQNQGRCEMWPQLGGRLWLAPVVEQAHIGRVSASLDFSTVSTLLSCSEMPARPCAFSWSSTMGNHLIQWQEHARILWWYWTQN